MGIFASCNKNPRHVIEITKAAEAAGKEVILFFTHKGVLLTQEPEFKELIGHGRKSLCNVSYESKGLKGRPAPGIADKDFGTQARHGEMSDEVDRYIVM